MQKEKKDGQRISNKNAAAGAEKKAGKFIFANGDEYEGEYEQRTVTEEGEKMVHSVERSGKGTLRCANGCIYEGSWSRDQLNGADGLYSHPSGCEYRGEFRDGLFHGRGVYNWPGGARYEGLFKAGRMDGKGTFYDENGQVWVGSFVGDKQDGNTTAKLRFRLNL